VTNQPVVAKGFCTESDLQRIHNKLETLLGRDHAFLDRIYHCPHHPDSGFIGERADLKFDCTCRKPKPGMVMQAAQDMNINLATSWFVGDSTTDIQTARNAGVNSVLVRSGYAGRDCRYSVQADAVCDTLHDAARFVIGRASETCSNGGGS